MPLLFVFRLRIHLTATTLLISGGVITASRNNRGEHLQLHSVLLSIRHLHKKNAAALRQVFAGMRIIFADKLVEGNENGGKPATVMAAVLARMPQQKSQLRY